MEGCPTASNETPNDQRNRGTGATGPDASFIFGRVILGTAALATVVVDGVFVEKAALHGTGGVGRGTGAGAGRRGVFGQRRRGRRWRRREVEFRSVASTRAVLRASAALRYGHRHHLQVVVRVVVISPASADSQRRTPVLPMENPLYETLREANPSYYKKKRVKKHILNISRY